MNASSYHCWALTMFSILGGKQAKGHLCLQHQIDANLQVLGIQKRARNSYMKSQYVCGQTVKSKPTLTCRSKVGSDAA